MLTFVVSFYFNDLTWELLNLTSHSRLHIFKILIHLIDTGQKLVFQLAIILIYTSPLFVALKEYFVDGKYK